MCIVRSFAFSLLMAVFLSQRPSAGTVEGPSICDSIRVPFVTGPLELRLQRQIMPDPPSDLAGHLRLSEMIARGEAEYGTEAFLLTRGALETRGKTSVVWIEYVTPSGPPLPPDVWSASVVWSAPRKKAFVVVGRSVPYSLSLSVFRVESLETIAPFPLTLDIRSVRDWPKGARPLARKEYQLSSRDFPTTAKIKLVDQDGILLVFCYASLDGKGGGEAKMASYDIDKGQWSDGLSRAGGLK